MFAVKFELVQHVGNRLGQAVTPGFIQELLVLYLNTNGLGIRRYQAPRNAGVAIHTCAVDGVILRFVYADQVLFDQ